METDTENEKVLTPFLRSLLARGLDSSQGLLVIIDGGKGLKAGDWVTTGSTMGIYPVAAGSVTVADFGTLGKVDITFAA